MSLKIVVGPADRGEPFAPDAVVLEDDTFRVLGADRVAKERYEDVGRLLEKATDASPDAPGTVRVREGSPAVFHAIVHDLEQDPSWREEWVMDALYIILTEADRRELKTLSLPPLGSIHGSLQPRRFAQLLRAALDHARPARLERLRLVTVPGTPASDFDSLREFDLELLE